MSNLLTIYDQAAGPVAHPAGVDGFMAYGGGNDDHTWSRPQINEAAQTAPLCFPVWEYGQYRSGEADGMAFAAWLSGNAVPDSALVLLSMETYVDAPYVEAFEAHLAHELALYGSLDSLFANPETPGGWWPANPTGVPHLFAHSDVIGTQYAWTSLDQTDGYDLDLSLVRKSVPAWRPLDPIFRPVISAGNVSLRQLAGELRLHPAEILRITARCSPPAGYLPDLASYINGCNLDLIMPPGLELWVPVAPPALLLGT